MKKNIKIVFFFIIILFVFISCVKTNKPEPKELTAPHNLYPAQAEVIPGNNFYARWTKSTDEEAAVRYTLRYARNVEGLAESFNYETNNNYFLFPHLESGVWYWQVNASLNEKQVNSPVWTFTVDGQGLPVPVEPENEPADPMLMVSEVTETGFTLDWQAYKDPLNPANPITYTINIYEQTEAIANRTKGNASQIITCLSRSEPATTAHTTDTSHTFINLPGNSTYLWTLIAGADASRTTALGSGPVKTGNSAPTQPELLTPTEGATNVPTDVTLNWSKSTDPDSDPIKYYVYIDTVKNTNRNVTVEGIEETHYQPEGLEKGRTYYWFILVKDDNGAATRTQAQSFMTQNDGMDIPHNPSPTDASQDIDALVPPLLQWEHDQKDQPITYTLYLSDTPKTIPIEAEGLNQQQYQIPDTLQGDTTYYWQVAAINTQTAKTTKSGVWTFKTAIIPSPTQTSAQTNREGTQIELTYDKAMADPTGKHKQYTVKKTTENQQNNREEQTLTTTKIESKPGTSNQYLLSLETPVQTTDTITIDYTRGSIQAQDGSYLNSYTNEPVENKVPGQKPILETVIINSNGQTIDLEFDKAMQAPTGTEYEQFGVLVNSYVNEITGAELKTDEAEHILLTVKYPIGKNNQVHVSYTKGTIQSTDGAYLESFQNKGVDTSALETHIVMKAINWHYHTIQEAIDDAQDGDTIKVYPGTYEENLIIVNKAIHLTAQDPTDETIRETTIIDAGANDKAGIQIIETAQSSIRRAETNTIVEGFTITNAGSSTPSNQRRPAVTSGIHIIGASPIIRNNIICQNATDYYGGGILVDNSADDSSQRSPLVEIYPQIFKNVIRENSAEEGAGIYIFQGVSVLNAGGNYWKRFNSPETPVETTENTTQDQNEYSLNELITLTDARGEDEGRDICFAPAVTPEGTITAVLNRFMETDTERWDIAYTTGFLYASGTVVFELENFNPLTADAMVIIGEENHLLSTYDWATNTATITNVTVEEGGTITLSFSFAASPSSTRNGDKTVSVSGDADGERKANLFSTVQELVPEIINNKPINPNPTINKLSVALDQEFTWENENTTDPFTYDFYLGTNVDDLTLVAENLTDLSYEPIVGLNVSTQYFWQVVSKSMTFVVYSPIWSFKSTNCISSFNYGGVDEDYSYSIVPTPDGGLLVGALSDSNDSYDVSGNYGLYDVWVMKLDAARQIVWEKNYGGSNNEESVRVLIAADGNYIIVASTNSNDYDCTTNHGNRDILMVKVQAENGAIMWANCFGGSSDEYAAGVELSTEGNVVVVGYTNSTNGDVSGIHKSEVMVTPLYDIWLFEVNQGNGEIVWNKCYGGDLMEVGTDVKKTNDGGYIILGSTQDYSSSPTLNPGDLQGLTFYGQNDIWIVKIADNHEIEWSQTYGTASFEYPEEVEETDDGGYLFMAYGGDLWIEKIDSCGNSLFQNKMTSNGFFYSMHKINNQYIVAGHTNYTGGIFNENRGLKDVWHLAFDKDTNLLWKKSFGGSADDRCFNFCLLPNGNLMTAAITWSSDGDVKQIYGIRDVWLFESSIP